MKQRIENLLQQTIDTLVEKQELSLDLIPSITVERTKDKRHGDFTTNIAMLLAKPAKKSPKQIAEMILNHLPSQKEIRDIQIAGPGFINFYLSDIALQQVVNDILKRDGKYGHSNIGQNKHVHLEFVSSNPTGPLHVGHGRLAAYGASVANLLEAIGYRVHREYYVNDAGRQMDILTVSIWLRYLETLGESLPFPRNGYKGDYIIDIAKQLKIKYGEQFHRASNTIFNNLPLDEDDNGNGDKEAYVDALIERAKSLLGDENYRLIFQHGLQSILEDIREDLSAFGVIFQEWFHESQLYENGDIQRGIERLKQRNHLYEREGATWFSAIEFGDEKDRVVIRENGQPTYFASDIGYHLNKYQRGFETIIDIFGADHHGYSPRIRALLKASGEDADKLKVLLVQFAVLYRGKQKVSMSTRSGTFVTLRELREEVGNDAARFFYVMRKHEQHLDFDLELAKSHSSENPVYYIQYAHARICSVFRQLEHQKIKWDPAQGLQHLAVLNTSHEQDLLNNLSKYPEIVESAALNFEPSILANYLQELANYFHTYYNAYKFIVDDEHLRNARLCLVAATQAVLTKGLHLLGISAPEYM